MRYLTRSLQLASRALALGGRHLYQVALVRRRDTLPFFVFGCQRSGTNMLVETLGRNPAAIVLNEAEHNLAFVHIRLRPVPQIRRLLALSRARTLVLKPIADSQWADELLAEFPTARAVWIHRHWRDVARSAVRLWGDHQLDVVRRLALGRDLGLLWRAERVGEPLRSTLREHLDEGTTPYEGACLFWWLRNRLYFDLGLDRHERLRTLAYEAVVQRPEEQLPPLFQWAGLEYRPRYGRALFTTSVKRGGDEPVADPVASLCDHLHGELLARSR